MTIAAALAFACLIAMRCRGSVAERLAENLPQFGLLFFGQPLGPRAICLVEKCARDVGALRTVTLKANIELLDQTTDHIGSFISSATDPNQSLGDLTGIGLRR